MILGKLFRTPFRNPKINLAVQMSCCPPNSHKFLAHEYTEIGTCAQFANGTEYYHVGSAASKKAILIIPDIWGWHGGRIRNIADQFAEAGYYAIVPKILLPALEGGTDGDGNVSNL